MSAFEFGVLGYPYGLGLRLGAKLGLKLVLLRLEVVIRLRNNFFSLVIHDTSS